MKTEKQVNEMLITTAKIKVWFSKATWLCDILWLDKTEDGDVTDSQSSRNMVDLK